MEKLIKQLESQDETERRYAAEDLAEYKESIVIDALIHRLQDPVRAVAEAAVESLIVINGSEVCQKVIPLLYSDNSSVRNYAIEVLEKTGESDIDSIIMLLKDEDHDIRKFAADILGYIAEIGGESAYLPLIKTLDDQNVNVSAAAAEALGRLGNERALPFLARQITRGPWMQCNVIQAICEIGGDTAVETLKGFQTLDSLSDESRFVLTQSLQHLTGIQTENNQ